MNRPTEQRYPSGPATVGEQKPGGKRNIQPYYKAVTIHPQNAAQRPGRLIEDELLSAADPQQKLIELVQQRYSITRDEADQQVKSFIQSCKG